MKIKEINPGVRCRGYFTQEAAAGRHYRLVTGGKNIFLKLH